MSSENITPEQVLLELPRFKKMNAWGRDIYIKPAPTNDGKNTGLILIDDLMLGTITKMEQDGFNPAAIICTSPHNYQAWIRLSFDPIPREMATAAARIIAARYGADIAAAQDRQFGRLAGFTNRKPIHEKPIFVTSEKCNGLIAGMGQDIVEQAAEMVRQDEEKRVRLEEVKEQQPAPAPSSKESPSACYLRQQAAKEEWLTKQGHRIDRSRVDWMIACDMLKFRYTIDEVAGAIAENSTKAVERNSPEQYARTTAEKAAQHIQQQRLSQPKPSPKYL